jgi:hypothetical protein
MQSETFMKHVFLEMSRLTFNFGWARLILMLKESKEPEKNLWNKSISSVTRYTALVKRRRRRRSKNLKELKLLFKEEVKQFLTLKTKNKLSRKPKSRLNQRSRLRLKLLHLRLTFHFLRTSVWSWSKVLLISRSVSRWWATWSILALSTPSATSK